MGPAQAKNALKECLAVGADQAFLVTDRAFGGSDTLATSYILSCAIKKVAELEGGFDAIFCGKQAIDGDTAQVGPEIAEHLGLPQVTYALEAELTNDGLTILKECEDANQKIAVSLPCLVTFTKPSFDPRYPTIKRKLAANRAEIPVLGEDAFPDIEQDPHWFKRISYSCKEILCSASQTGRRYDQRRVKYGFCTETCGNAQ